MYLKINSRLDNARNIYKLMNGVKPQDLIVKTPFEAKPAQISKPSGLLTGLKNIVGLFLKVKG